jgi:hypothetical protein
MLGIIVSMDAKSILIFDFICFALPNGWALSCGTDNLQHALSETSLC